MTTLPQVTVAAGGAPLPRETMQALGQVRVQQRLSLPTLCELAFYDPPGPLTAASHLTRGTDLRVSLDDERVPLFTGEVTAVQYVYGPSGGREVRIRGYDRLHRLRKRGEPRAHVQVTLQELAEELVADLGLTVRASDPGPLWPRVIQHRQTDFELLHELADRCGLYLNLREDTLHLLTLEGTGNPVSLSLGKDLLEARVEANDEPACRSVTASGWNPLRVEAFQGRTTDARVGRQVTMDIAPDLQGGRRDRHRPGESVRDRHHAEAMAQAELDRHVAQEVTIWGVAQGNPRLRPGTPVVARGIAETLAGRYTLTAVTHTLDHQKGFLSEFSTAAPPPRPSSAGAVAALGEVTRVDDPEGTGRVRVSLPAYQGVETEWMHVLAAGAGKDKGLMILPDVGDRVLVLFSHGDPGQGVVLGALYGMQGPHDSGVEGTAVRRYTLLTPGGQEIQLDDTHSRIRLVDSTGSFVELTPEKVHLHAAVDLEMEAPGRSVTIRGDRIDFERG
jgi:uncharacterized protein involved in type VI secretion and phage assembly